MDYSLLHRCIIFLIQCLPLSITILICLSLARLFKLYQQGILFDIENIILIKRIAQLMIGGEILSLIYQPLITMALSFNNPPGERFISITLSTMNGTNLLTACIIFAAALIMQEARQLQAEQELTI